MGYGVSKWRVWSTYAQLCVTDERLLLRAEVLTRRLLAAVDRTCSRFREDSDLSRLNATPGRWVEVDPLLVEATRVAVDAARISEGLVDPCVGRALVSWGYDVDLELLVRRPVHAVPDVVEPPADWREIRWDVDALLAAARLPARPRSDRQGLGRRPGRRDPGRRARLRGVDQPRR